MKELVAVLLLLVASTAYGEIYTWKDARGTLFYTNSLYEIPARYRARAKLLDVATGKKVPIGAAQPAGPAGPAGTPPPQAATGQAAMPQPAPAQAPPQASPAQQRPEQATQAQPSPQLGNTPGAPAQQPQRARRRMRHGGNQDEE